MSKSSKKRNQIKDQIDHLFYQLSIGIAQNDDYEVSNILTCVKNILDDAKDEDLGEFNALAVQWGQYHHHRLIFASDRKDEIVQIYRDIIQDFEGIKHADYSEEYQPVQQLLTTAYKHLARHLCHQSKTKEDIKEAVGLMDDCFHRFDTLLIFRDESASFVEKIRTADCYEVRAIVYNKARAFDSCYELGYYKTLYAMNKAGFSAEDTDIQKALDEVKVADPLQKLKFGTKNESVKEATERYMQAFNMGTDLFDFKPVCTLNQIQKEEEQLGFSYPESVREFRLMIAGAFHEKYVSQSDDFLIQHEVDGFEMNFVCRGVASEIAEWYCKTERHEDENTLTEWREEFFGDLQTFDYLNTHFKVIGTFKSDAERQYYFLIGSNQRLGMVIFRQDWWESIFDLVEKDGLNTVMKYTDFEALVSKFFSIIINEVLFEDEEWLGSSLTELLDKDIHK